MIRKQEYNLPPQGGNAFTYWLGKNVLRVCGWKIEGALPPCPKMVVAIAPHTSNWDFCLGIAVLFTLRVRIRFLGKHTIFVPIAKQLLEYIGGIPVTRCSPHGVVNQIVDKFNSQRQMILALAPEGTRSLIYPWKTGFLAIAHKANVPIVLIGFDFKDKSVKIGPVLTSTGDFNQDMQIVYRYFAQISAKYPNKIKLSDQ